MVSYVGEGLVQNPLNPILDNAICIFNGLLHMVSAFGYNLGHLFRAGPHGLGGFNSHQLHLHGSIVLLVIT